MNLTERWSTIMGPKDERLEAEANRCLRIGHIILLAGTGLALYYAIMLNQVANTTNTPIFTSIGQNVFPVANVLLIAILVSCLVTLALEAKVGIVDEHVRIATIDHVPWGFCAVIGIIGGVMLGVITAGMRMLAELQIVGLENVAWAGDIAIGVVFFVIASVLGTFCTAVYVRLAIDQRKKQESMLED